MSIIAFNTAFTSDYYLKRDVEKKTPFKIGVMDSLERMYFSEKLVTAKKKSFVLYEMVRLKLKGWENLVDHEGKPVLFETETVELEDIGNRAVATKRCMDAIAPWIIEISKAISEINRLAEQDEKN
jgi:hypothetical protein